jgi:hypothetical protein
MANAEALATASTVAAKIFVFIVTPEGWTNQETL